MEIYRRKDTANVSFLLVSVRFLSLFLSLFILWHFWSRHSSRTTADTARALYFVGESDHSERLFLKIPSLVDARSENPFMITEEQRKRLGNMRVLIVNLHCYGNVGDEMETTPLIGNLYRWGVGTIDAVVSTYSWKMKEYWYPRPRHSSQWLNKIYEEKEAIDYGSYDFVIHAPGPYFVPLIQLKRICKAGALLMGVGFSLFDAKTTKYNSKDLCKCIRLLSFREYNSYNSKLAVFIRDVCKRPVIFSGDLSFSYLDFFNYTRFEFFKQRYDEHDGFEASIFFRPYESRPSLDLKWQNTQNKALAPQLCIFGEDYPDMIWPLSVNSDEQLAFATTDIAIDEEMMSKLKQSWPKISQVSLTSVEQLWAFTSSSKAVYTTRYHAGIATKIVGSHLIVLPHLGHPVKMNGLLGLKAISNSVIRRNNDDSLQRVLETLANG